MSAIVILVSFITPSLCSFLVVSSPSTPFRTETVVATALSRLQTPATVRYVQVTAFQNIEIGPEETVLDYSYRRQLSAAVAQATDTSLTLWPSYSDLEGGEVLEKYALHFAAFVREFNLTGVKVLADWQESHTALGRLLVQNYPGTFDAGVVSIPAGMNQSAVENLVGHVIKPGGNSLFALITSEKAAALLLAAFTEKKMMKAGYAFFLCDSARTGYWEMDRELRENGLFYVVREATATAASREEMEAELLTQRLQGAAALSYALINIRKGSPQVVISRLQHLLGTAVFPGNATSPPASGQGLIPVSVNYDFLDANGYIYPYSRIVMRGFQIAFEEANNRTDLIPHFLVSVHSLSLSGLNFNVSFTTRRISENREVLGLLHIPPPLDGNVMQTIAIMNNLNVTVPMVTSTRNDKLADPGIYPYYLRTRPGDHYEFLVIAQMMKFFKWKRLTLLYSEDGESVYTEFLEIAAQYGLNITNTEALRAIPAFLNSPEALARLNSSLSEILHSTSRIVYIIHQNMPVILPFMYDVGFRSGFLIWVSIGLANTLFNGEGEEYYKRRVVAKGAMLAYPRGFLGSVGSAVLRKMIEKDGSSYYSNSCFYYDCAMLYLYATDYMLTQGIDYESPQEIMKAMRGTFFQGCGGTIRIGPGSNQRPESEYSIRNAQYFEANDSASIADVVYYNPFSITLFKVVGTIMWPDNSTTATFADTLTTTSRCPFPDESQRQSAPGLGIGMGVSVVICVATAVVTVLIWKRWWRVQYPLLTSKQEMSVDDVLQLASVPMEFFQCTAVGPDSKELSHFLASLCASTVFDVEEIISIQGNFYWTVLHIALGCVGAYLLLSVIKLLHLESKLEWLPMYSFLMLFANLVLPVLSTLLFLPIISTLSKIYLCYNAYGDSLRQSYLNKDCFQTCWNPTHSAYVVVCSVCLCVFIPLGTFTKPMWQELQPNLHIRAQPLPLMVKSLVQVVLITIDNTLKQEFPGAHAAVFLIALASYFLFLLFHPLYNYHRYAPLSLNLWQAIALLLAFFYSIVAVAANFRPASGFVGLMTFFGAVCAAVAVGLLLQTFRKVFESKLHRHVNDPTNIIAFAFSFGSRAQRSLELHKLSFRKKVDDGNKTSLDFTSRVDKE